MRAMSRYLTVIALGCLTATRSLTRHIPQPILDRGDQRVLDENAVVDDIRACRTEVRADAPVSIQPRWLPPLGATDNGVVIGTVDVPHPVWPSVQTYRHAIEFCLTARGYKVHGWQ